MSEYLTNSDPGDETATLACPACGEEIWDMPSGSKLAKCWNAEGHEHGGTLAFDMMADDDEEICHRFDFGVAVTKAVYGATCSEPGCSFTGTPEQVAKHEARP